MKKKRRLLQSDTFWGLTAAVLVLLQFWWLPGEDGSAADSYSTTIDGKLGLFRTLSELFPRVERDSISVVPKTSASLLIIAPDRYPNDTEEQQLYQFVYNGGELLFAPNWFEPEFSLPGLGIELSPRSWTESTATSVVPVPGATPVVTPTTPAEVIPSADETPAEPASGSAAGAMSSGTDAGNSEEDSDAEAKNSGSARMGPGYGGTPSPPGMLPQDESLDSITRGEEVTATSELVDGSVTFRSTAQLELPDHFDPESLVVSATGVVEAATWPMGSGRIVVCSSPDVFSNRSLLYKDSRRLAVRLVERCVTHESGGYAVDDDSIVLSEYFNASDAFQQTGILFSPTLRIGTLQLLLVAVLGIWLAFHRFGPATEVTTQQRRSLTESAQAVGNLQYRLHDGGAVIRSYLEYMRSQLRRRYGSFLRLDDADAIANRSGLNRTEVSDKLREATAMSESAQLSTAKTAAMLRWLSTLQRRLTGTRESGKPKAESG